MSTKFFTNKDNNTVYNKFEHILSNNNSINCFDAVVGYLRASGYFALREVLNNMQNIRILVGIDTDKFIAEVQKKGLIFFGDAEQSKEELLSSIKHDIETSEYTKEIEDGMLQFIDDIVNKKIEVRAHPSRKIHAKIYLLYPNCFNEHTLDAAVITGSSNLTGNGLGIGSEHQYEFNVLLQNNEDVQFAKNEFEMLWSEAEGCNLLPDDINKVKQNTYLSGDVSPFDLYIKMLIEYFGDRISYDFNNFFELPEGFKKMEYQIEAVDEGYKKLLKYDGFFLSDVVGLGKTVIATMIAKRFSLENGIQNTKILVVYPPALEKNWKTTFDRFGITNAKFISNGSLDRILDTNNYNYWNAEEYDLILVDESHKFRNHETGMFKQLQEICKCPRINKGQIEGRKKKVMLISATPLNNKPEDLYNQILLFQNPRQCTLDGVANLTAFFAPRSKRYQELKRATPLDIKAVQKLYEEIREKVIKPLTIRRTRTDILSISRYKKDVEDFPIVERPLKVEYRLNEKQAELFKFTVDQITEKLNYSRYQAITALKPEVRSLYYEKAEFVSKSLAGIVKNLLVKRLESSFYAFKKSLSRFKIANEHMIGMFNNDKIFIAPDLDIEEFYEKGLTDEEIEIELTKAQEDNPKNHVFTCSDFINNGEDFKKQLESDNIILNTLWKDWEKQIDDPKLNVFLNKLETDLFNRSTNEGQKLVVFSESTDTIDYLAKNIKRNDIITISAKNRNKEFLSIEENFDANYPKSKWKNNFNILLTTDVLAEGINLHRSNVIINYDTPWNATRLMQRIGRINRIGSISKHIYNYVFYPSAQGNEQISLVKTSLTKIQSFHTALGEDNQIYSQDEIVDFEHLDKLFEVGNSQEEVNKELLYLEFLRKFKFLHSKDYIRICKLNLRSRCGRNDKTVNKNILHDCSLIFLKTGDRNNFYKVTDDTAEELTALQAIEYFEANPNEKRVPRIDNHFIHVQKAIQKFHAVSQEFVNQTKEIKVAGQKMNSAIHFVRNFKSVIDNPDTLLKMDHLIKLIEWGTITSLTTDLSRMERQLTTKQLTRDECMDNIIAMAEKYNNYFLDEEKEKPLPTPMIILSESFN